MKYSRSIGLALTVGCLVIHVYFNLRAAFFPTWPSFGSSFFGSVTVLLLFSLFHGALADGFKASIQFFILSAAVSWLFEEIGVLTGKVYGAYHYSDQLGIKLGHVPLLIPVAWFMMIYPSYFIARFILHGNPSQPLKGLKQVSGTAFLGAMVMTAWDAVMDPVMAKRGVWVWENGGRYFGVPIQNFVGWMLTCFTIYFIHGLSTKKPSTSLSKSFLVMPIIAYSAYAIRYIFSSNLDELKVVGFFSMGFPAAFAWAKWLDYKHK